MDCAITVPLGFRAPCQRQRDHRPRGGDGGCPAHHPRAAVPEDPGVVRGAQGCHPVRCADLLDGKGPVSSDQTAHRPRDPGSAGARAAHRLPLRAFVFDRDHEGLPDKCCRRLTRAVSRHARAARAQQYVPPGARTRAIESTVACDVSAFFDSLLVVTDTRLRMWWACSWAGR